MPTLDLRRDIARVVRQVRPQAVVTANFDFEAYGGLNQADHRAAGLATVDAVRDADNTWVFRDLADDEGLPKWHTQWLLVAGHPDATHAMAVDAAAVEAAVGSLSATRPTWQICRVTRSRRSSSPSSWPREGRLQVLGTRCSSGLRPRGISGAGGADEV